jgi:hypothetical protein
MYAAVRCRVVILDLEVVARPGRGVVAGEAWRSAVAAWLSYYRGVLASSGWLRSSSAAAGTMLALVSRGVGRGRGLRASTQLTLNFLVGQEPS